MDPNLLNYLPEKWRGTALLALALSPYITRGLHALYAGKGIRGALAGIWLGTNAPKEPESDIAIRPPWHKDISTAPTPVAGAVVETQAPGNPTTSRPAVVTGETTQPASDTK
jgi:hypothetical protein